MEAVFAWVSTYGYEALFGLLVLGIVGVPVPDETLLVFCGYLIAQGKMTPWGAYLAAAGGSLSGITISYMIGRTAGLGVVHRLGGYVGIKEKHLEPVHAWFARSGHWALFGGYYVAGVRHFTAIVAGASKLEFHIFALYAWSGGLLWVAAFLSLGYFIGEKWREAAELVHHSLGYVSVVLILAALGFLAWRWRRNH
jgi:membrane protein DedA with SNARE-associated domain